MPTISLPDIVGKGYKSFWNCKKRYLVCKGSRGSKKSTTAALKIIHNIMKYPEANALIVRRFYVTHRESTFAQLKWAINRLQVDHLWKTNLSPLQLTYLPTGQVILFRGLDDPQSIASITVEHGFLCFVWIEEAFQVMKESDFDKLDLSIRGEVPDPLFKQIILTFNPWSERHWLKARFFDVEDEFTKAMTTNYLCNEWLGPDDKRIFEKMKERFPRRYEVEGLGNWGISEGLIYTRWSIKDFDWKKKLLETDNEGRPIYTARFGMDFGFTTDPTAFIAVLVSVERKEIWIFDEIYKHGWTNENIARDLKYKEYHKVKIVADSAERRTIDALWTLGLNRIVGAKKGPDSIRAGINKLQDYTFYVHPSCTNTEVELNNYVWAKHAKTGDVLPKPASDGFDHLLDALRYISEDMDSDGFSF
jgi:phage terminase large subunit